MYTIAKKEEEGGRCNRELPWPLFAVCVFNFPGPFSMQISSVIYPEREREDVTEERTCGGRPASLVHCSLHADKAEHSVTVVAAASIIESSSVILYPIRTASAFCVIFDIAK